MKNIKLLFMDVDGTLTDGKIYMGNDGEIFKAFSVKDGYAITHLLKDYGITPVIITARESEILKNRCKELNITHIFQNCADKKEKMLSVAKSFGMFQNRNGILHGTAYIGDDLPDLECMKISEFTGCPADSAKAVTDISDFVSEKKGGQGAVRDFIEWIIK